MPLRVLLADENLAVQRLVELTLGKEGVEVTATDNGLSALDLALKRTPDLILVDFNLEGLNIFSFVKKIKNHERLSDIPIILLINAAQHYDSDQFQLGEISAFFRKPIDAQELLREIKNWTESTENLLVDLDPPQEKQPSDIAQYFSDPGSDTREVESLLGWSSPESSADTVAETPQEEAIALPSITEDAGKLGDDPERPGLQTYPFIEDDDAPVIDDDAPGDREEPAVVQAEDSSPFPFASIADPENEVSDAEERPVSMEKESISPDFISETDEPAFLPHSESDLDLEENQARISPPDSTCMTQNPDENIGEQVGLPQAVSGDEAPSVDASPERVEEPMPPSLPPATEGLDSGQPVEPGFPLEQRLEPEQRLEIDEAIKKGIQESVEKVVWEVLPELLRTVLSKEMMVSIVEKIAWETTVPLVESEVKKEIRRLRDEVS